MTKGQLLGAIARGWCSKENAHKEMDTSLAFAIADEVWSALPEECKTHSQLDAAIDAAMKGES